MKDKMHKRPLGRIAERVEMLRDELKVRVHLAGLEAKDAWDRAHLERIGDEIAKIGGELKVQSHLGGLDAKEAWDRLESMITELRGKLGTSGDGVLKDVTDRLGDLARKLRGGDDGATAEASPRR